AVPGSHIVVVGLSWGLALLVGLATPDIARAQQEPSTPDAVLELPLKALLSESVTVLDLTYSLNDRSPFWPGDNYEPFRLKTIATLEKNGVVEDVLGPGALRYSRRRAQSL